MKKNQLENFTAKLERELSLFLEKKVMMNEPTIVSNIEALTSPPFEKPKDVTFCLALNEYGYESYTRFDVTIQPIENGAMIKTVAYENGNQKNFEKVAEFDHETKFEERKNPYTKSAKNYLKALGENFGVSVLGWNK